MRKDNNLFDMNMLDLLRESLKELGKSGNKSVTRREIVEKLKEEIRALRKQGFSFEQIATAFSNKGVDIAGSTLREYAKGGKPGKQQARKVSKPREGASASRPAIAQATKPATPAATARPRTSAALNEEA